MVTGRKNPLSKRLAELCMERKLSYYELSLEAGVPLTTLLHIADGSTKNPGIYTVMKICNALCVSLSEFVAGLEEEL